jgi:hypothetical protein
MPADLVSNEAIPKLAAQIDSPAMLTMLGNLQQAGFIMNGQDVDQDTFGILQRLAALGLADPGYDGPTDGKPFIWVSNHNGQRVLRYLQSKAPLTHKVQIHPRAQTALASLSDKDRQAVLAAVEALQADDPDSWPRDKISRLSVDTPFYLLRASPVLRAFIRILEPGRIELFDIVREETLRLFLERQRETGALQ